MREARVGAKVWIASRWDSFGLPFLVVLLLVVFSLLSSSFRSSYNLVSNLAFASLVGIGSIGMAFCIMSGDFDISIGSMSALAGVVGASLVPRIGGVGAVLLTIAIATVCGFVNGVFVTKLKIPAFITTLGMQFVYRALAYIYTTNRPVYIKDPFWLFIGSGTVLGIPFPIIITAVCFAAAVYVLRKTPFGRYVIAVGTNKNAAMLSGISVEFIKNAVFTLVGFFVGIATVVTAPYLGSVNPGMTGQGYEFQVITVVVLGGTALTGGNGNLLGAFFAALFITYLQNGLGINQVNSYWQYVATGFVLIFAVGINRLKSAFLGQREI
jgi:ribose/xylose/arabinose/galactoside ABC-type transport system permease subunit